MHEPQRVPAGGGRGPGTGSSPAATVARVASQAAPAPAQHSASLAHRPQPVVDAAAPTTIGRPAPTREAVLTAYQHAIAALPAVPSTPAALPAPTPRRSAPATTVSMLARSVSRPTALPTPSTITPFGVSTLARAQVDSAPPQSDPAPVAPAPAEPVDLDLLADYVLERLRHELRDGRERLGFLLDDNR